MCTDFDASINQVSTAGTICSPPLLSPSTTANKNVLCHNIIIKQSTTILTVYKSRLIA